MRFFIGQFFNRRAKGREKVNQELGSTKASLAKYKGEKEGNQAQQKKPQNIIEGSLIFLDYHRRALEHTFYQADFHKMCSKMLVVGGS